LKKEPDRVQFETDWAGATARARDEYSLLPARY
jgi:hypothetical protein